MPSTSRRKVVLGISISLGVLLFVGSILWMKAGAGIAGSPLAGIDPVLDRLIVCFLLTGPMSLLPASVCAIWRPRWAGLWLIMTALVAAWLAGLVMTPANPDYWIMDRALWSNTESLSFYIFKWSLALITPFSLPILGLGLWLLLGGRPSRADVE